MKHIIVDLEMNAIAKEHEEKGSTHKEIIEQNRKDKDTKQD